MDGYDLHIAVYEHRHGRDVNAYWVKAGVQFGAAEAIARLGETWEGEGTEADRDDEYMEVFHISDSSTFRVES